MKKLRLRTRHIIFLILLIKEAKILIIQNSRLLKGIGIKKGTTHLMNVGNLKVALLQDLNKMINNSNNKYNHNFMVMKSSFHTQ